MVKIRELTTLLEQTAPLSYQESYDNSGLIVGNPDQEITSVLVTLDCIEEVVDEAIETGSNLIVAHHPIVFSGLKKLNGKTYVERTVIKAIKNNIAIYAIHTNLDNVKNGVNYKIAEKLGLQEVEILRPKSDALKKLVTFIPKDHTEKVLDALYKAGAGTIGNYRNCSFRIEGTGSFEPNQEANPFIGQPGKMEFVTEDRAEILYPGSRETRVISALRKAHPYEVPAYYIQKLDNIMNETGAGAIGNLSVELSSGDFLNYLKSKMELSVVRHTRKRAGKIKKVAVCGGSGSFLLKDAIQAGADCFITADFKYHEFFDAEDRLMICDIGHYESEVFTKELIKDLISKKFTNFAVVLSKTNTNPISYF
jgi:dinuclear metal center YbgI/SA1388 family protein